MIVRVVAIIFNLCLYFQYNWSSIVGNSNWSIINWLVNNGSKLGLGIATFVILVSVFRKTLTLELTTKVIVLISYLLMLGINILEFSYSINKLEVGIITINKVLTIEDKQNLVIYYVQLIMLKNYEMFKNSYYNDYYLIAWKEVLLCIKEYVLTSQFIELSQNIDNKYDVLALSLKLVGNSMEIYNYEQSLSVSKLLKAIEVVEPKFKYTVLTLLGYAILNLTLYISNEYGIIKLIQNIT